MLQTLFHIPHAIFDIPLFGWGWGLGIWALIVTLVMGLVVREHGWKAETLNHLTVFVFLGLAIFFLRHLEARDANGVPVGLPIRGYGVMLLLGIVSGVGLAMYRARRMGVDPELIMSLAFSMLIAGIVGARLFFVIEFWEQFQRETVAATVVATLKVTEGGLVVYGSLVGALIAACIFLIRHRLPILAIADLIAPSLTLGLAFGRIGCLFNGCCFGQVCDAPWAISFPRTSSRIADGSTSPPYDFQLRSGQLHGVQIGSGERRKNQANDLPVVVRVEKGSAADEAGFRVGDRVTSIGGQPVTTLGDVYWAILKFDSELAITTENGKRSVSSLSRRSLRIHPTQIYSSINALLLCLFLLAYYPYRRRDGEVIAICLTIYPVARYLLEMIRADESIAWGLTISQVVSGLLLLAVLTLWMIVLRQPRESALPPAELTGHAGQPAISE